MPLIVRLNNNYHTSAGTTGESENVLPSNQGLNLQTEAPKLTLSGVNHQDTKLGTTFALNGL